MAIFKLSVKLVVILSSCVLAVPVDQHIKIIRKRNILTSGRVGNFTDRGQAISCMNGGSAVDLVDQQKTLCICNLGYYGDRCEENNCSPGRNPCQNKAVCQINTSTQEGKATCQCADGYYGELCEISDNSFCSNHGTSMVIQGAKFCICDSGFTGSRCEKALCAGIVCHYGTCAALSPWFKYCDCDPGYYDSKCDKSHCDVLAVCSGYRQACVGQKDGRGYRCDCPDHRTGQNCEEAPCTVNPCKNGGTCTAVNDLEASCTCQPGYNGSMCEIKSA